VVGGRVGAYLFGTDNGNQAVRQSAGGKAFCGAVLHKHLFVIRDEYYSLPRQLHLMGASENMAAPIAVCSVVDPHRIEVKNA
jgi:hypothetical protein